MTQAKNKKIAIVKLRESNQPKNGARDVENFFSHLTVRLPSHLLGMMMRYAAALNWSLDDMVASALNSEIENKWWDSQLREIDPKLADKIHYGTSAEHEQFEKLLRKVATSGIRPADKKVLRAFFSSH